MLAPARQCAVCGVTFAPVNAWHRYCTISCREKRAYQRASPEQLKRWRRNADQRRIHDTEKRKKRNACARSWRRRNPAAWLLYNARHRAKKYGWNCTITKEDVYALLMAAPAKCPALGISLIVPPNLGRVKPGSMTLDRIDSNLGYIPGNVQIISYRANTLKRDGTPDELERLAAFVNGRAPKF